MLQDDPPLWVDMFAHVPCFTPFLLFVSFPLLWKETDSPGPPLGAVVHRDDPDVGGPTMDHPSSLGGPVPGGGLNMRAANTGPTSPGLAPERDRLMRAGLSTQVVQNIQVARVGSTIACYKAKWLGFQRWCKERRMHALTCAVGGVLSFLQYLVEKGLSHATVKVYAVDVVVVVV